MALHIHIHRKTQDKATKDSSWEVVWTTSDYTKKSKKFAQGKLDSPDKAEREARAYAKKLESDPKVRSVRVVSQEAAKDASGYSPEVEVLPVAINGNKFRASIHKAGRGKIWTSTTTFKTEGEALEEAKRQLRKQGVQDAREQKFGIPVYSEEEVLQKIRNGEWESETDVAKGKRVEMRKGSKRFQVYVKDASYAVREAEKSLQAAERLRDIAKSKGLSALGQLEHKVKFLKEELEKAKIAEQRDTKDTSPEVERKRLQEQIDELTAEMRAAKYPFQKQDLKVVIDKLKAELKKYPVKDAIRPVPGKKYRSSRGIVTYVGPDKEGRHGDIKVKTASGFTLTMHEDDLTSEFAPGAAG